MKKLQVKIKVSLGLVAACLLVACQTSSTSVSSKNGGSQKADETNVVDLKTVTKNPGEISVMEFNVENMFDNVHDTDREDFTYLPIAEKSKPEIIAFCKSQRSNSHRKECEDTDWSDTVVKTKLANIAKVIRAVDAGQGPDNLMMEEVENESVLKRLVNDELGTLGYQTVVLIDGPDLRGIDPGFISKFPLHGKPQLHLIPYEDANPEQLKWAKRSRGILEATVTLPNGKDLTFLVAHFPSQQNPVAWRIQAVKFAKNLIATYTQQGRAVIFGGDLNISAEEEQKQNFFKSDFSSVGQVSHLVGCKECLGSHNFRGEWSFLDALIFSNGLPKANLELIPESIEVVRTAGHMKKSGAPLAFRPEQKNMGVSDHFPIYSRLKLLK
jgi:endonuclease/exonuclease/phosphatase family metal-dependent hydrolase